MLRMTNTLANTVATAYLYDMFINRSVVGSSPILPVWCIWHRYINRRVIHESTI